MGNFLFFSILGIFCLVLQSTVFAYITVVGLRIELLLIILTYIALYHPVVSGCFLAVFLGYLYDLNSASPFGLHMLTFLTSFLLLNLTRNRIYVQGPAFCIGLTAVMVWLHEFAQWFYLSSRGVMGWPTLSQMAILIPKSLITGALWPLLCGVMIWIDRKFPHPYQPRSHRSMLEFK